MTDDSFEIKVKEYIRVNDMLKKGCSVTAGISGGADSVCLFFVLQKLREEYDLKPKVLHVMHGIREEEAERDMEFTKDLCKKYGVPFEVKRVDVPELAAKRKESLEEAGRYARYQAFKETGSDRIAVAHNANDRAETVLFNLFRGSGIRGLCGIEPVNGNIIRPLLGVTRNEIEEYLKRIGEEYVIDSTNLENEYSRNRIRNVILKNAAQINAAAVEHICESAQELKRTDAFLGELTDRAYENYVTFSGNEARIPVRAYEELDGLIFDRLIYRVLADLSGRKKDITSEHVKDVAGLFAKSSGKKVSLIYSLTAMRSFDEVIIKKGGEGQEKPENITLEDILSGTVTGLSDGREIKAGILKKDEVKIENLSYTKWFDYDKIKNSAVFRTRKNGDTVSIPGGNKKLKDVLIEARVPADERDSLYVLADGQDIMWVPGIRYGEKFKVTPETKRVLEISLKEASDE